MASVELAGRLLVSLAVVLGLMWVIARKLRGGATGKGRLGRAAKSVEVLDRVSLSRSASVAVVRVNGEALVLGVAEHSVTVLGSTDLAAALAARTPARKAAPRSTVQGVSAGRAARTQTPVHTAVAPAVPSTVQTGAPARSALGGSALSPQTWRQTIDSLRDLTART